MLHPFLFLYFYIFLLTNLLIIIPFNSLNSIILHEKVKNIILDIIIIIIPFIINPKMPSIPYVANNKTTND